MKWVWQRNVPEPDRFSGDSNGQPSPQTLDLPPVAMGKGQHGQIWFDFLKSRSGGQLVVQKSQAGMVQGLCPLWQHWWSFLRSRCIRGIAWATSAKTERRRNIRVQGEQDGYVSLWFPRGFFLQNFVPKLKTPQCYWVQLTLNKNCV